jgi:zinc transport system permease protein
MTKVMDDFIWRALIAGLVVAVVAGTLGVFVVWRRMAYFGDSLSHSALLGIALGILTGVNTTISLLVVCLGIAVLVVWMESRQRLSHDTLLGIFAHSSLSLGLVALSLIQGLRIDLMAYLFGDILAVTQDELYWIIAGGAAVLVALLIIWRPLLALTVNEDLARVEGVRVDMMRLLFMLLMALVVAVAMKLVGVLLITSLLIIPAAVARRFSHSPEQMALLAVIAGSVAVAGGMAVSLQWDTPTGPSIVVVASLLFMVVNLGRISDSAA